MFRDWFGSSKPKAPLIATSVPPTTSETILGVGTHLQGHLTGPGHVRIEGTFTGDVAVQGKVAVGEQAKLEGNLIGESVTVSGVVRGDVVARKISVLRTGRVWGDLRTEQLATEEGGFIQGQVTMEERVDVAAALAENASWGAFAQTEAGGEEGPPTPAEHLSNLKPAARSSPRPTQRR